VPERQDIIWIDCNPQAGREMRDVHPFLVLSPRSFNERTSLVAGLPVTTAEYNADNPFAVAAGTAKSGKTSYVLCHQPKSFDWRAREASLHPLKQLDSAHLCAGVQPAEPDHHAGLTAQWCQAQPTRRWRGRLTDRIGSDGDWANGLPTFTGLHRLFPPKASNAPPATMAAMPAHRGTLTVSFSLTDSSMGPSFTAVVSLV